MDTETLRKTIEHRADVDEIMNKVEDKCIPTNSDLTTCEDGARLYRCIDHVVKHLKPSTEATDAA